MHPDRPCSRHRPLPTSPLQLWLLPLVLGGLVDPARQAPLIRRGAA